MMDCPAYMMNSEKAHLAVCGWAWPLPAFPFPCSTHSLSVPASVHGGIVSEAAGLSHLCPLCLLSSSHFLCLCNSSPKPRLKVTSTYMCFQQHPSPHLLSAPLAALMNLRPSTVRHRGLLQSLLGVVCLPTTTHSAQDTRFYINFEG